MINNEHILSREEMKPLFLNPTIIFKEAGCLPFMSVNVSFTAALIPYKILAYLGHLPFGYAWPRVCYASIVPEVELVPIPSVCSMFLQASGSWCILCASDLQRDGNLFDFEIIEMKYKNIQEIFVLRLLSPGHPHQVGPLWPDRKEMGYIPFGCWQLFQHVFACWCNQFATSSHILFYQVVWYVFLWDLLLATSDAPVQAAQKNYCCL